LYYRRPLPGYKMGRYRNLPGLLSLLLVALVLGMMPLAADPLQTGSRVVSLSLMMPQLQHHRRQVWIYLPPGYDDEKNRRYPVLYMQDGQDLFDPLAIDGDDPYLSEAVAVQLRERLRWYGNWQVDRTLDRLALEGKFPGLIVVGISSRDGDRTAEYSPWLWSGTARASGEAYVDFIVQTLKPYVDRRYRTLPDRSHTGIAGSSLGGLISLYGGLKYQQVFSKIGAFSPVLTEQVSGRRMVDYIRRRGSSHPMKIYLDLGSSEPGFGPVEPVYQVLRAVGFLDRNLWFRAIDGGRHRIEYWRRRFPAALLWLYFP
ncbi:MAG: alpha/beta hydrolase-fold protein, partial [Candidatus Competibacteraceae bacterium]|nr:alpha/beta hydrolase-fold protein [Candidatus Competibacteraceae bacterium]